MNRGRPEYGRPNGLLARVSLLLALASLCGFALAADGLTAVSSPYGERATMDRLESVARKAGMKIFARIDHAAGARTVGRSLRPTEVLIFGNPKGGTPFMECSQTVGIDLPMKLLVWTDESNKVWIGYNDPAWIGRRHGVESCPAINALSQGLARIVEGAIAPAGKH